RRTSSAAVAYVRSQSAAGIGTWIRCGFPFQPQNWQRLDAVAERYGATQGRQGTGNRKHSGLYRGCRLRGSSSARVREWRKQFYNFCCGIIVVLNINVVSVEVLV